MNSKSVLIATALVCFGLIGVAMYLQHVLFLLPCPLCVIQRYLFIAIGVACLIGAFSKPKIGAGIGLLAALGGLAAVSKHLWVLAHPGLSCGIDPMETFLNKIPTATSIPWLFYADGICENATEGFLGLSIPQWSLIWFVILGVLMAWTLLRKRA